MLIESGRMARDLRSRCLEFSDILDDYQSEIVFHEDIMVNADETRIDTSSYKPYTKAVYSSRQKLALVAKEKPCQVRSMITFCNASGNVLLNVVAIPCGSSKKLEKLGKVFIDNSGSRKKNILNSAYTWTAKGWITKVVWKQSVKLFVGIMKNLFPGCQVILIIDKLAAHMDWEIVQYLYDNGVYCFFFLPKKSSHILQSLDQMMFDNFKNFARNFFFEFQQMHIEKEKLPFDSIIHQAVEKAFTKKVVCKSFEMVGLCPFLKSKMIDKIIENTPKTQDQLVNPMMNDMDMVYKKQLGDLQPNHKSSTIETQSRQEKVMVKIGEVYTTYQLIARKQQQQEIKKRKEIKLKQIREEKKRKREEKKRELMQRREERKKKRLICQQEKKWKIQQQRKRQQPNKCLLCSSLQSEGEYWYICSKCKSFRICSHCENRYNIFKCHLQTCEQQTK